MFLHLVYFIPTSILNYFGLIFKIEFLTISLRIIFIEILINLINLKSNKSKIILFFVYYKNIINYKLHFTNKK